jgi:hypothetical protein
VGGIFAGCLSRAAGLGSSGLWVCRRQLNTDHRAACRQLIRFQLPLTGSWALRGWPGWNVTRRKGPVRTRGCGPGSPHTTQSGSARSRMGPLPANGCLACPCRLPGSAACSCAGRANFLALEELLPICCPGLPEPLGGQRAPGRRAQRWGWRRLDRSVRATARAGRLVRMLGKVVEPAVIAAGFCLLRAGSGAAVPTWGHGRRSDPHRWGGPHPGNGGRFDGWDRYECAVNTVWQDFSVWGLCLYNTAATPPWSSMPSSEPTPGSFPPPATAIPAAGMKASRRCRAWPPRRPSNSPPLSSNSPTAPQPKPGTPLPRSAVPALPDTVLDDLLLSTSAAVTNAPVVRRPTRNDPHLGHPGPRRGLPCTTTAPARPTRWQA